MEFEFKCPETCPYYSRRETHFVPPEGPTDSDVIVVGEAPGREEFKAKRPFVGPSGKLLRDVLESLGKPVRIYNACLCAPTKNGKDFETPPAKATHACIQHLLEELRSNGHVKRIVALGKVAYDALQSLRPYVRLLGEDGSFVLDINGHQIEVINLYHPAYILRRNHPRVQAQWKRELSSALVGRDLEAEIDFTLIQRKEDLALLLEVARSWQDSIGFDIESNGLPIMHKDFRAIGYGFAFGRRTFYCTVPLDKETFLKIFGKNPVLVFNATYEGVFFQRLGIDIIRDLQIRDVRALAISLNYYGSLKEVAARVLGSLDWSKRVAQISGAIAGLVREAKSILKSGAKERHEPLLRVLREYRIYEDTVLEDLPTLRHYMDTVGKTVFYEYVPVDILGRYCAVDCYSTWLLEKGLAAHIKEQYGVKDIWTDWPYNIYTYHFLIGAVMEHNGIIFDKGLLLDFKQKAEQECLERIRSFVSNPRIVDEYKPSEITTILTTTSLEEARKVSRIASTHHTFKQRLQKAVLSPRVKALAVLLLTEPGDSHPLLKKYADIAKDDTLPLEEKLKLGELLVKEGKSLLNTDHPLFLELMKNIEADLTLPNLQKDSILTLVKLFTDVLGETIDAPVSDEFQLLVDYKVYKKADKMLSTYIKGRCGLKRAYISRDGFIYDKHVSELDSLEQLRAESGYLIYSPNYMVCGAVTRRWKSSVHTIPPKSPIMGLRITRFGDRGIYLKADHSQMELRCLSHEAFADEPRMRQAFEEGQDIHRFVASLLYEKPPEEVADDERRRAKGGSFGIVYCEGVESLAKSWFDGDVEKAQEVMDKIFTTFPGIKKYMERNQKLVKEIGLVRTLFGDYLRPEGEEHERLRQSVNYPIQSSSSTLVGLTIYWLEERLREEELRSLITIFTHDCVEGEIFAPEFVRFIPLLKEVSEDMPRERYNFPAKIDIEIGVRGDYLLELSNLQIQDGFLRGFTVEGPRATWEEVKRRLELAGFRVRDNVLESFVKERNLLSEIVMDKTVYVPGARLEIESIKAEVEICW